MQVLEQMLKKMKIAFYHFQCYNTVSEVVMAFVGNAMKAVKVMEAYLHVVVVVVEDALEYVVIAIEESIFDFVRAVDEFDYWPVAGAFELAAVAVVHLELKVEEVVVDMEIEFVVVAAAAVTSLAYFLEEEVASSLAVYVKKDVLDLPVYY